MTHHSTLQPLLDALDDGSVELVDLTHPLSEQTAMIELPPPFANTPDLVRHELSRYDERGPAWAWSWLELGEHAGTHIDAPIHWISGRGGEDVASIPRRRLVGPAVVVDVSAEVAEKPDFLVTIERVRAFEDEHGPLPENGWLLIRSGWDARADDRAAFLNDGRSPGIDAACAHWLAHETPLVGVGVETVGIDAGAAPGFEPPLPVHHFMLGAGKYGLAQLTRLGELPPSGAVLVVAPLKLAAGTGSPTRVLALAPRG